MTGAFAAWGGLFWFPFVTIPVFWIGVIIAVVILLNRDRSHHHHDRPVRPESSALHLLEERYARGEVSREEFLERRAVLLGTSPPAAHPAATGAGAAPPSADAVRTTQLPAPPQAGAPPSEPPAPQNPSG